MRATHIANPTIQQSLKYNLATGKDQSANVLGYKPESEKLVWMSPERYLSLVAPLSKEMFEFEKEKGYYTDVTDRMKTGKPMDALWLDVDTNTYQVRGHEGRHRAKIAQELGIKELPVILYARDGREWAKASELPEVHHIIREKYS